MSFLRVITGSLRWNHLFYLKIAWHWELCMHTSFPIYCELYIILINMLKDVYYSLSLTYLYRSEFGGLLIYYYLCDRTDLFGESKKVWLNGLVSPRGLFFLVWRLRRIQNLYLYLLMANSNIFSSYVFP